MAIYAYLDVQKEETITAAIAYAVETWGRIDGAINNAGAQQGAAHDTHDFPEDEWTPIIDIDLTGVYRCMKAELAAMLKTGGGTIVNISSLAGLRTVGAGAVAYHSAKAGVIGLTKAASSEYANREEGQIRINCIAPGAIWSDTLREAQRGEGGASTMLEGTLKATSMKRIGDPEEIGNVCLFLSSDLSSYMTGQILAVDGGTYI